MKSEIISQINSAKNAYETSVRSGNGIRGHKEALKNILFNNYKEIFATISATSEVDALKAKIASLDRDIESLTLSLAEADEENRKLRTKTKKTQVITDDLIE